MKRLFETDHSIASFVQRVVLAAVIFPHGAQKLLGWYGGWGFTGTLEWFAQSLHVPTPIALLVIISDFFGAIALATGAFTRLAAFGTVATMLGAVFMVHAHNGFFMNWGGSQAGEGFEYHLLAIALSLPLIWKGAGAWSLDRVLAQLTETTAARSGAQHA